MLIKKILFRLYVSLLKKKWGMTAKGANICGGGVCSRLFEPYEPGIYCIFDSSKGLLLG